MKDKDTDRPHALTRALTRRLKQLRPSQLGSLLRNWKEIRWLYKNVDDSECAEHQPPLISIIIPMHNTEKYVEKCVRSAMEQTLDRIEIICVDDASPDNCSSIIERLARNDQRIRLVRHDRNLGLGGARNTGIDASLGIYVTGIDSDDYILPGMMEQLWLASNTGTADVVACGYARVNEDGTPAGPSYLPQRGSFVNNNNHIDIFEFLNPSFCNKIWKKTLFTENNISFPEHTYFEDLAVTPCLLWFAKDIRVISEDLYQYVIRKGSITNSHSFKHIIDHFKVFDILDDFLLHEDLHSEYGRQFTGRICNSLAFYASRVMASRMEEEDKRQFLRFCLMLQVGYVEYKDRLRHVPAETLQFLIASTKSSEALDRELSK